MQPGAAILVLEPVGPQQLEGVPLHRVRILRGDRPVVVEVAVVEL
jgi:hypothetical protein